MKIDEIINNSVRSFSSSHYEFFDSIGNFLSSMINGLSNAILTIPWFVWVLLISITYLKFSRKIVGSILVLVFTSLIYFLDYWKLGVYTVSTVLLGVIISVIIGIPLGILMSEFKYVNKSLLVVLDIMQTLPSFIYLLPSIMLFGVGNPAALISIIIYAIPPITRLTCLGISEVDETVVEASVAYGATRLQTLFMTKIPLSINSIFVGLNQTIMMALAMVVTASMVGARGLGQEILSAINQINIGRGLRAGVCIVIIAVVLDRLIKSVSEYVGKRSVK